MKYMFNITVTATVTSVAPSMRAIYPCWPKCSHFSASLATQFILQHCFSTQILRAIPRARVFVHFSI